MCEALDDHEGSVSIGGRLITNFRFADDIVVNAEEEEEAGILIDQTPVKLKLNTNFLNHFPVTVDTCMFSKTWSFLTYTQDHSVKNIKFWKRSMIKMFPIEDNAFLKYKT